MDSQTQYEIAKVGKLDQWVPACGGTEKPFKSQSGITMLYCWNPKTGQHAYINCDTDTVMSDKEAFASMGIMA